MSELERYKEYVEKKEEVKNLDDLSFMYFMGVIIAVFLAYLPFVIVTELMNPAQGMRIILASVATGGLLGGILVKIAGEMLWDVFSSQTEAEEDLDKMMEESLHG